MQLDVLDLTKMRGITPFLSSEALFCCTSRAKASSDKPEEVGRTVKSWSGEAVGPSPCAMDQPLQQHKRLIKATGWSKGHERHLVSMDWDVSAKVEQLQGLCQCTNKKENFYCAPWKL